MDWHSIQGGEIEILMVATEMRDKTWPDRWPWPDRPLGSNTGFMLLMISSNS